MLPKLQRTGLLPVRFMWGNLRLCEPTFLRVIPRGPSVPFVMSVTDGINMLSGTRIVTRTVKVTIEEVAEPHSFGATISGQRVTGIDIFCADPLPPRYEINFHVPDSVGPGAHNLELSIGRRALGRVSVEVV
jgi:hypothetical protein